MGRMPNVEPEVIVIWGNLPALPDDSPSSTVPGTVRYAGWNIAPFPLTLTLSLGEREQLESRSGKPTVQDFSAERMAHPLPKGEGWGGGKNPPHRSVRMPAPIKSCPLDDRPTAREPATVRAHGHGNI